LKPETRNAPPPSLLALEFFTTMLTDDQRNDLIVQLLNAGKSLSEVQRELERQGVKLTYFDLRLLAADLQVNWQRQDPVAPPKPAPAPAMAAATPPGIPGTAADEEGLEAEELPGDDFAAAPPPAGGGATTVSVNKLVRPGAAISGEVSFASGAKGEWYVDNYGRLGLQPAAGSAKPTQQDIMAFQQELQRLAQEGRLM
jgi:hypothetical protein